MPKSKEPITVVSKISTRPLPRTAALVVIYGEDLGRKFDLKKEITVIGRSSKSDIQIDQDAVSRNHARIVITCDIATISDMGSTNGTGVNDIPIQNAVELRNGDFIKIGRTILKYIAGGNIEAQYHDEIYRLTTVDGLTQISNKRYFIEALEREISRAHRYGRALSLAMMDLDDFKSVNDTYGHLAGDFVLRHMATLIKAKIRRDDVFARYGGEEFALILPEIDMVGAVTTGEKVRKLVEKQPFVYEDRTIPVTISVGVASLCDKDMDMQALLKAADGRLYLAKQMGRNRVCS